MSVATVPDARLEAFYAQVRKQALHPLWLTPNVDAPRRDVRPWLWPWSVVRKSMLEACEIMPLGGDGGADRRVLTMSNPTLERAMGPTRTLTAACQLVKPHEVAPSHRHSIAALRFIVEGDGGCTIVDGEPLTMEPGDFLLTPSWTWHGHTHEGTDNMLWLDVLDVPLVRGMNWQFYEEYSSPRGLQEPSAISDASLRKYGTGSLLPTWMGRPDVPYSPLFSYKWSVTRQALYRLADLEPSPYEGFALTFTNPFSGGPVMPTIDASMHLLRGRQRTLARRTTSNTIYHVAAGSGFSVLDGQRFNWQVGDTFCVPTWCWQEHAPGDEDAILFGASDRPVLESLGLYREEALEMSGGHQHAEGTFEPAT